MKSSLINLTQTRTRPRWLRAREGRAATGSSSRALSLSPFCRSRLAVPSHPLISRQSEGRASLPAANLRGKEGEPRPVAGRASKAELEHPGEGAEKP